MTRNEFFALVEADLRLRHVPFDAAELEAFVEDVWPLVEPGDEPARWAELRAMRLACKSRGNA
jgi:hypothetical protein